MKNLAIKLLFFSIITIFASCNKSSFNLSPNKDHSELYTWGIQGNVVASKSLNKSYNFYFDQIDGSAFDTINCAPTVATMALLWNDSLFNHTPSYARSQIKPNGGLWTTDDIMTYLASNKINSSMEQLGAIDDFVKSNIDQNRLIILCVDMHYIPYNVNYEEHVNSFYQGKIGTGHSFLVKGYIKTDTQFYLEVYDPASWGIVYYSGSTAGSLKGKNRYYLRDDVKAATDNWWQYGIVIYPDKGKSLALNNSKTSLNQKNIPVAFVK